jgi:two-component system, NtrC family, nitrogen regulation response regulator NtrX
VLASTHRDLLAAMKDGRFREDLYYRLNVFPVVVPPLRARPDDILPLAQAFAVEIVGAHVPFKVTPSGEAALRSHDWPGNVRELRNAVERLSLMRRDERVFVLDAAEVVALGPGAPRGGAAAPVDAEAPSPVLGERSLRTLMEEYERGLLQAALEQEQGNIASAARLLKTDRGNLHRRLRALGIATGRSTASDKQ